MGNARMNVLTGGDATTALCSLLNAVLVSGSGLESENKGNSAKSQSYVILFY